MTTTPKLVRVQGQPFCAKDHCAAHPFKWTPITLHTTQQPQPSMDTLQPQRLAAKTRVLAAQLRLFVSSMSFNEPTPRRQLATTMLMASMEHAEAVAFLMEHGPYYYGMPAIALLRPQIECFLRGVFFHSSAVSEQEVSDFVQHDRLPKRPDGNGRMRPISLNEMETIAHQEFTNISVQLSGNPISRLFPFRPQELHGLVHGGADLVLRYRIDRMSLGFNAPDNELLAMLGSCGLVACFSMSYIAARIAQPPDEEPRALREAHDAFRDEFLRGK